MGQGCNLELRRAQARTFGLWPETGLSLAYPCFILILHYKF